MMCRSCVGMLLFAALFAAPVGAIGPTAVPDFTVYDPRGAPVHSREFVAAAEGRGPREDRWLLVYTSLDGPGWDDLLRAVEPLADSGRAERVVIIVRQTTPDLLAERLWSLARLASLRWHADPDGSAGEALSLRGVPMALGVKAWVIEWARPGISSDLRTERSALGDWVTR